MHIDHVTRLRLHMNQKEKEVKQGGRGRKSIQADCTVQWCSGVCSRLGPRESNEDRMVALPDLAEAVNACASSSGGGGAGTGAGEGTGVGTGTWTGDGLGTGGGTGTGAGEGTGTRIGTRTDTGLGTPALPIYHSQSVSDTYSSSPSTSKGMKTWTATGTGTGTGAGTPTLSSYRTRSASDAYSTAPSASRGAGEHSKGRRKMKDALKQKSKPQGYFAVYDGHCGAQAATHLQETLHTSIFTHPLYHTDINTAIVDVCVSTDQRFLAHSRERMQYSGSTVLGALIRGDELVVFNIGDCHAVVCCDGAALDMSDPHKPNRWAI